MLPEKPPILRLEVVKDNPYAPSIPFRKGDVISIYKIYTDKRYPEFGRSMLTHNRVGYITIAERQVLKIAENIGAKG